MLPKQVFLAHLHAGPTAMLHYFKSQPVLGNNSSNSFFWAHWFPLVHRLNVLKARLYPPVLLGTFQETPQSERSIKPVHEVCLHSGTISRRHKWQSPTDRTANTDICCQHLGRKLHMKHFCESTCTLPQRGVLESHTYVRVLALFSNLRIICYITQNIPYARMKSSFSRALMDSTYSF